ncbi:MAG TPA: outer membrane lipoprotein carrier protein LolA [Bryobacteraceae bacterium]|nr:outer membrane lipoprotein carrier protein LolA [Bryobacteraceae bacterium]
MLTLSVYCASAASTDTLIHQLEDRYNKARTLSLHFEEDFSLQGHRRPPESGILTLRKQGKMRWDYTQPAGKLFISDGKTVYLYTAADNRVEKIPVRDTADMRAPMAFLLGHLDLKKEFRDFTSRPGEGGTWLEAKAKSDRAPYETLALLVAESGAVGRMRVMGKDGSELSFVFQGERLNPPIDDKLFHFAIPAGAEVVNAVEFSGEGK